MLINGFQDTADSMEELFTMILQLEAENQAEEMGRWVKCFPHKHGDLGLDSGIHEKESRRGSGTCNPGAG